jgi:hypothetical protein
MKTVQNSGAMVEPCKYLHVSLYIFFTFPTNDMFVKSVLKEYHNKH